MITSTTQRKRRRIYVVRRNEDGTERLVMAGQRNSALSHVATNEYGVRRAHENDLVRLLPTHKVEEAVGENETGATGA